MPRTPRAAVPGFLLLGGCFPHGTSPARSRPSGTPAPAGGEPLGKTPWRPGQTPRGPQRGAPRGEAVLGTEGARVGMRGREEGPEPPSAARHLPQGKSGGGGPGSPPRQSITRAWPSPAVHRLPRPPRALGSPLLAPARPGLRARRSRRRALGRAGSGRRLRRR